MRVWGKLKHCLSQFTVNFILAALIIQLVGIPGLPLLGPQQAEAGFLWFQKPDMGKQYCPSNGEWKNNPGDPCYVAEQKEKAGTFEDGASIAFFLTSGVCAASCAGLVTSVFSPACTAMTIGTFGGELAATFVFAKDAARTAKQMGGTLGDIQSATFAMGGTKLILDFTLLSANGLLTRWIAGSVAKKAGEAAAKAAVEEGAESLVADAAYTSAQKKIGSIMCWLGAGLNFAESSIRRINADRLYSSAADDRNSHAAELRGDTRPGTGSPGAGANGTPVSGNGTGDLAGLNLNPNGLPPSSNIDNIVQSAVQAGYGPVLDEFKKTTGTSPEDFLGKIYNDGKSPMEALSESMGSKVGADGAEALDTVAALGDKIKEHYAEQMKQLAVKGRDRMDAFAVVPKGDAGRKPAGASAMPDFSKLFGGGDSKPAAQGGSSIFKMSTKNITADSNGFYGSSVSLFDAVDARYKSISPRIIAGETVVNPNAPAYFDPALAPPANPYLGTKQKP